MTDESARHLNLEGAALTPFTTLHPDKRRARTNTAKIAHGTKDTPCPMHGLAGVFTQDQRNTHHNQ